MKNDHPCKCSGYICIDNDKQINLAYASIDSIEPLCDQIIISFSSKINVENISEFQLFKENYNHPKFSFIDYRFKKLLGTYLNKLNQRKESKKRCHGKVTVGITPGQKIAPYCFKGIHNMTVVKNR